MNDRAQRALVRGQRREEAAAAQAPQQEVDLDAPVQDLDEIFEEREDIHARAPRARGRAPAAAFPAAIDPGMWLNMVNIKAPYLSDLELESMKKFILDYKRYSQRCPQQLLRRMQQFILEEQLEVICEAAGIAWEEVQELDKEEFILVMLQIHQANSSRKWRLMIKNAKMEKSDLSLNTYVQYVEDFKFWVMAAGLPNRIPEKEIVKCFVNGLKPELFKEEMFSKSCDTLVEVMAAARADLATYREFLEISNASRSQRLNRTSRNGLIMLHLRQKRIFLQRRSAVQVPFQPLRRANPAKNLKKKI